MSGWFQVDRAGLAEIARRRGMSFIVTEPIQNAWDEQTGRVEITLAPVPGTAKAEITVTDDSPDGFRDLADSYMMFRSSYKLANPEQRGRFNIGEKLLLAVADEARVTSTTGSVIFGSKGRTTGRKRTQAGSILWARLRMTRAELAEAIAMMRTLIPPDGITTVINGHELPARVPLATARRRLDTEIQAEGGGFRYTSREADVRVYAVLPGETAHLYEMGISVDELSCPWHVEIGQKVPLSVDRGAVRWGFQEKVEEIAASLMAKQLTNDQATEGWVSSALRFMDDDEAVRDIVRARFGKAVTYDPSCPEANKLAMDAGYNIVHGGELPKSAWSTIRRAEALAPAGRVFGTGKVDGGTATNGITDRGEWSSEMEDAAVYATHFTQRMVGKIMPVSFYGGTPSADDVARKLLGTGFRPANCGGGMAVVFNMMEDDIRKAVQNRDREALDAVLIHECAHVAHTDHLTHGFHRECCRIGAKARAELGDLEL